MFEKQKALVAEQEVILHQELIAQVTAPLQPESVVVDGGCSNWPYIGQKENRLSTRDFGTAQYVAFDGGESSYLGRVQGLSTWHNNELAGMASKYVDQAHERGINARYLQGDLRALPFANESIDELFMGDVVLAPGMDPSSFEEIAEEANRTLKTSGLMVIKETETHADRFKKLNEDLGAEYNNKNRNYDAMRRERWLQLILKDKNFELTLVDAKGDPEVAHLLNTMYCTSDSVSERRGVYLLARKLSEVTTEDKPHKGLRRLLGRRALA